MKRITYLAMALSCALVVAGLPVGPAVPGQRATRPSMLDRHHLVYGLVIPSPTDAPHGSPGERYVCLTCHALDTSSGSNKFVVERDCQVCHATDRHHPLYDYVISSPTDAPFGTPGESYVCLTCHAIDTSSGVVKFPVERDCRVCHNPRGSVDIQVMISPYAEGNPVNLMSDGILSVLILGSLNYAVTDIDRSSVLLEGQVAPLYSKFLERPEGRTDLTLNFAIADLSKAIGPLPIGQTYDVWVTGIFREGTPFTGSDYIVAAGEDHGRGKKGRGEGLENARAQARARAAAERARARARERAARERAYQSAYATSDERGIERHRPRRRRLRPRQVRGVNEP